MDGWMDGWMDGRWTSFQIGVLGLPDASLITENPKPFDISD
jgi:hypothetical protein